MNKNEKLMILSGLVILIFLDLLINTYLENSEFKIGNMMSHTGLLLVGIYFFFQNWKINRKNKKNT